MGIGTGVSNPFEDDSRWVMMDSRFRTDPFIVDEMKKLLRECYGDEVADAMEASMPPPWGTMEEEEVSQWLSQLKTDLNP